MKKYLLLVLAIIPCLAYAQPKADWKFIGTSFSYENGKISDAKWPVEGAITELFFAPDGTWYIGTPEKAALIYSGGKYYSTQKILFNKEEGTGFTSGGLTTAATGIATDKNNALWFGTEKGLLKIDHEYYKNFGQLEEMANTKGVRVKIDTLTMPFAKISQLERDAAGNIWVTGQRKLTMIKFAYQGLSRYDGEKWMNIDLPGGLAKSEIKYFVLDQQGNPIVVYQDKTETIATLYKDGAWKSLGSMGKGVNTKLITVNQKGEIYGVSANNEVMVHRGSAWEKVVLKTKDQRFTDIKFDKDNTLWLATDMGVLCVNNGGGEFKLNDQNSPLPMMEVSEIKIDADNRKWFVTARGLLGYKEPEISVPNGVVYSRYNSSVEDGVVETIKPYGDGFLMVYNALGLAQFDGKEFKMVTPYGKAEVTNNDLAISNGKVYIGTYKFIHTYDGTSYNEWKWEDDIGKQVNSILADNQGQIWIASKGVSKYDGTSWKNWDKKTGGLSSNSALKLFQDSKNRIWAALSDGVAMYDGTIWTSFTKKTAGMGLGNMNAITEAKDGKILFSNGYSLIEYDGTSMKEVVGFKKVGELRNMFVDDDGTLVMATQDNGIAKFKDGALTFCNTATCGLPSNQVNYIYKDKSGSYWVSFGTFPPVERPFPTMGAQPTANQPPPETAQQAFQRKVKSFDLLFLMVKLSKI